jgi:hypothetical protein
VGPDVLEDVIISSMEGRRVRSSGACVFVATLSPHPAAWSGPQMEGGSGSAYLRGVVEGAMAMVKTASMLFGGGANQRSADVFRQGSRLILEFV